MGNFAIYGNSARYPDIASSKPFKYQTLSVSGSFSENTELELLFINQQTGSDSISSFSDLEIT